MGLTAVAGAEEGGGQEREGPAWESPPLWASAQGESKSRGSRWKEALVLKHLPRSSNKGGKGSHYFQRAGGQKG